MDKTWASGAIELFKHAESHIRLDSAFDQRIAFISIDNCVETCIRSFLSMPKAKSGVKVPRSEIKRAEMSFPSLLALLFKYAPQRLFGLDEDDIEHYHRIRNTLYHEGTGLSVDSQYLLAYRGIAEILLQNLFAIAPIESATAPRTLELLIQNWNSIEKLLRKRMDAAGFTTTYKWEEAFASGLLEPSDVEALTELRMARNRLVHSNEIDPRDIAHWAEKSEQLRQNISKNLEHADG